MSMVNVSATMVLCLLHLRRSTLSINTSFHIPGNVNFAISCVQHETR